MNRNTLNDELYRALAKKAVECSGSEFDSLLRNFGYDDRALECIQKTVRERLRYEDSGSYCESASPGYAPLRYKQDRLDDFYIKRAQKERSDISGKFNNSAADSSLLLQAIERLETRLNKLESKLRLK